MYTHMIYIYIVTVGRLLVSCVYACLHYCLCCCVAVSLLIVPVGGVSSRGDLWTVFMFVYVCKFMLSLSAYDCLLFSYFSVVVCFMSYFIIYYTIIYYTILYNTIQYYTTLYYIILYYTILYYIILHYTIQYNTILYCTILYYNILCYTILH